MSMSSKAMKGKIQTVLGVIDPSQMGITLTHEHLLIDLRCYFRMPDEASRRDYIDKRITIDWLGNLARSFYVSNENLTLLDEKFAVQEILKYKFAGGQSLVDTTSIGIARDPLALARISRATGLNIIMGGSHYVPVSHPDDMDSQSEDDIADRMETEGLKPWERVGLGPQEFMRWRNSGMSLEEWRNRNSGREMQLILRPGLGYGRGPGSAQYYGSYARGGADSLAVQEVYAWQSQIGGSGIVASLAAGFGVTPYLEAGFQFGFAGGRYDIEVQTKTVNNTAAPTKPTSHANGNVFMGPYLLGAFMPGSTIRPVAGLGFLYWTGTSIEQKEKLPDALPVFAAPTLFLIETKIGAEARISKVVDGFIHVPITAVIGGSDAETRHQGGDCVEDDGDPCLDTSSGPAGVNPIGAGVLIGLQFRLFGKRHGGGDFRDYDVGEDELD